MTPRQARLIATLEREFALAPGTVGPQLRLADHGDSLDSFTLLGAIEDEFDLHIDDATWQRVRTVSDLIALVDDTAGGRAAR